MIHKGQLAGCFLLFVSVLPQAFPIQFTTHAQEQRAGDDAALQLLVDRYFEALKKGSIPEYAALWSTSSPDAQARTQALERMFEAITFSYTQPRISRIKLTGDRAVVWVTSMRGSTRKSEPTSVTTTNLALALECVREGEGWRIWKEAAAVAGLARELVAAQTESERNALMSLDPGLLTRDLAFLLSSQSDRYYASGDYGSALSLQYLALRIAQVNNSRAEQSGVLRNIGNLHYFLKDYPNAIVAFRTSIDLAAEDERKSDLAPLWTGLGMAYAADGKRALAVEAYNRSLTYSREIHDDVATGNTLDAIALLKRQDGLFSEAAGIYQQVLLLRRSQRDQGAIGATLNNLAEVEYEQGEDERALDYYHQALAIFGTGGRSGSLVNVLHNVANLYYVQGNYELALAYYQREREQADAVGSLQGAAAALAGIGLVQTLFGDYTLALDAFRLCVAIWRQTNNAEEEANALQKVGRVQMAQGDTSRALETFQEALSVRERIKDQREIAWALLDVGSAHAVLRDFPKAVTADQRSLSIFESLADKAGIGAALVHLAGFYFVQEDYVQTIAFAGRAATVARQANDRDVYWQAKYRQGRAHYRLKQYPLARQEFIDAIGTIESKQQASAEPRPQRVLDDRFAPYLGLIDVDLHQSQPMEAFTCLERAKTRSLRLLMQGARNRVTNGMTAAELATEQKLSKERAVLQSQIARERERKSPQPARMTALTEKLAAVQKQVELFEQRLYRLRPGLKVLRGEGSYISGDAIGGLFPRDVAVLEFVETDEEVYLFVFTRDAAHLRNPALQTYALGVSRRELAARILNFHDLVAGNQSGWEPLARDLYEILIKPVEGQLKDKTGLLIVPDGWLWNLPFAALKPDQEEFLGERYSLSITPSLTALRRMKANRTIVASPAVRSAVPELTAFGGPSLSAAAASRMKLALRAEKQPATNESEREVKALAELYSERERRLFIGSEARPDRLLPDPREASGPRSVQKPDAASDAARARIIQLAIPTALNETSPFYSLFGFTSPSDDTNQDGTVALKDILAWRIRPEVVVMSESEIVPHGKSLGRAITSSSWATVVAGSPQLMIGRWQVEGDATTKLMLAFHRERRASGRSTTALQQAVREMIKDPAVRSPFFWAGFMIIGND